MLWVGQPKRVASGCGDGREVKAPYDTPWIISSRVPGRCALGEVYGIEHIELPAKLLFLTK